MVILCYQSMDQVLKMVPIGFVIIQVHVLYFLFIFVKPIIFHYHHHLVKFLILSFVFHIRVILDYQGEFEWEKYLLETNSVYAPQELFQIIKVINKDKYLFIFLFV